MNNQFIIDPSKIIVDDAEDGGGPGLKCVAKQLRISTIHSLVACAFRTCWRQDRAERSAAPFLLARGRWRAFFNFLTALFGLDDRVPKRRRCAIPEALLGRLDHRAFSVLFRPRDYAMGEVTAGHFLGCNPEDKARGD
jgi:hypothetical protein